MTMTPRKTYIALVLFVLACMIFFHVIVDYLTFVEPTFDKITDRHKEQLRVLIERSKLITGLATAIFGVTGALLIKLGQRSDASVRTQGTWIFILTGASLVLGYTAFSGVIWMLDSEFFNLYNWIVRASFDGQFLLFLAAAAILGHLFIGSLNLLNEADKEPNSEMPEHESPAQDMAFAAKPAGDEDLDSPESRSSCRGSTDDQATEIRQ